MLRGDYTDVIVNAHKSPDRYAEQKVTMPDGATATMICTIVDIEGEPREILFYIPDNASELQPDGALSSLSGLAAARPISSFLTPPVGGKLQTKTASR